MISVPLDHLPIFPLPNAVLIPGGVLPLHVFEPRYVELVRDCLSGSSVFGVARRSATSSDAPIGDPGICPVIGVGHIESHQQLPDGRYLLLLHGWLRARIVAELDTDKPYRIVRAEPIADELGPPAAPLQRSAQALRQLVLELARHHQSEPAKLLAGACAAEKNPGKLADLVGAALLDDPGQRQDFLEQSSVQRRLELLTDRAAHVLARAASSTDDPVVH